MRRSRATGLRVILARGFPHVCRDLREQFGARAAAGGTFRDRLVSTAQRGRECVYRFLAVGYHLVACYDIAGNRKEAPATVEFAARGLASVVTSSAGDKLDTVAARADFGIGRRDADEIKVMITITADIRIIFAEDIPNAVEEV